LSDKNLLLPQRGPNGIEVKAGRASAMRQAARMHRVHRASGKPSRAGSVLFELNKPLGPAANTAINFSTTSTSEQHFQ
jgi:hypothetical protein